ncbi:MAG TPA: protein kinase [Planctomycetota bacterium]|nr:protein kinase [Planctomycetota bacterium]
MSETAGDDAALVQILGRLFPSLAALDPAEGQRRAEAIGLYAASIWTAGPAALAARGVAVAPEVHSLLESLAQSTASAQGGGTAFLSAVRSTLADDARFAAILGAIATLYAQAIRAKGSSSGTHVIPVPPTTQPGALKASASGLHAAVPATPASPTTRRMAPAPAPAPDSAPAPEGAPGGKLTLREIAGFELLKLLGEGGMGKVFKARQKSLDRLVALKVLSPQLAIDTEYVARFHREALAAAQLKHPNVVGVIEHGTDQVNGVHFIAFEFLDGMSVENILKAKKKFPEREALAIARAVASALAQAEKAGIVHRDIKPDNVIVGRDGVPRLIDLGLAKKQEEKTQMTVVGVLMGTPQYMAPEQALGEKEIDHRADIYALGMTLYRLCTGQFAFDAESSTGILMKHITDECPDPCKAEPTISDGTRKIILKMAQREKAARYQSATDVMRDIDAVLAGRQPPLASGPVAAAPRPVGAASTAGRSSSGAVPVTAAGPAIPETRAPDEPLWKCELYPPSIKDAAPGKVEATGDIATSAIAVFARTGSLDALAEARKHLEARCAPGKDPRTLADAEALLAKALLLAGDKSGAEARARASIDKDWRRVEAAEVLARAARNDGDRYRLEAGLACVREAIAAGNLDEAAKAVSLLRSNGTFAQDPHPLLAEAVVAKLAGNESGFVEAVKAAWARFPSPERSDVWLAGLDGLAADMLVAYGRAAFKDATLARSTLERLDEKSNVVAGSLRMAIGIARVALASEKPGLFEQRRLTFAIARGFTGLRRYDAALEELQKVAQLNPTDAERAAFDAERRFTKDAKLRDEVASVPLPSGKYRCPATAALLDLMRKRVATAAKEKQSNIAQIEKLGSEIMKAARAEATVKSQLRMAAEQLGTKDPFETIDPIERELASVLVERSRAEKKKDESSSEKKGFLGKLSAAAAGVAGAAKDAALKVQERNLKSKHEAALKALAVQLAMELRDFDYTQPKLVPLVKRLALPGCLASVYAREEAKVQKDMEKLTALLS